MAARHIGIVPGGRFIGIESTHASLSSISGTYASLSSVVSTGVTAGTGSFTHASVTGSLSAGAVRNTAGTMLVPYIPDVQFDTSDSAGAISVVTHTTHIETSGAEARSLADVTQIGQLKRLVFSDDGGDCTVTLATPATGEENTITFQDAGQSALLLWNGTGWRIVALGGGFTGGALPLISTV